MIRYLTYALIVFLLGVNLTAFILMGVDKRLSKKEGARRIPEKTLFLPVLLGGGVGGVLGMRVFRHKTRHWYFRYGFPAILILELAAAGWLIWFYNFR